MIIFNLVWKAVPALIALAVLAATHKTISFNTGGAYTLILIHCLILFVGGALYLRRGRYILNGCEIFFSPGKENKLR